MENPQHRWKAALVVITAAVLILAWGASASADPGQSAEGNLIYECPYTGVEVTAEFDVTQLNNRNKGDGWATISTEYGSFSFKVKLARVDADTHTAYFAGPTSESKYAAWWYFAVRAGTPTGTGGAYGRYLTGQMKAEWVAEGYLDEGRGGFQSLASGLVTVSN